MGFFPQCSSAENQGLRVSEFLECGIGRPSNLEAYYAVDERWSSRPWG